MAASSRAQVLRLYRALLRESQRFSSYNYRLHDILRCQKTDSLLSYDIPIFSILFCLENLLYLLHEVTVAFFFMECAWNLLS
ncbi:LYR motif-containing protein 4 isoform X3 [Lathamus discolor]|uniref:LYR motif-containing protein 4 isoform X3 n=1 Tax=Lathamus discolor TaxID=678569 RepID=UPI0032B74279